MILEFLVKAKSYKILIKANNLVIGLKLKTFSFKLIKICRVFSMKNNYLKEKTSFKY